MHAEVARTLTPAHLEVAFREVQRNPVYWLWIVGCCLFFVAPELFVLGTRSGPAVVWGLVLKVLMVVTVILSFRLRMVTEIRDDALHLRYTPGRRRTIALASIRSSEVVSYYPNLDGGWGMKEGQGLRLRLATGESVVVGTQRPDELQRRLVVAVGA